MVEHGPSGVPTNRHTPYYLSVPLMMRRIALFIFTLLARLPSLPNWRMLLYRLDLRGTTCPRWQMWLGLVTVLCSVAPRPCEAQLYVGPANADLRMESLNEFILFDPVSKSQVLAFEFIFRTDEMPLGLILPTSLDSKIIVGKRTVFDALKAIAKPTHQKQRKLKLSFSSYLWGLLTTQTPRLKDIESKPRPIKPSAPGVNLTHRQAVEWALRHGLYIPVSTAKSLHTLANLGHRFNVLLFKPKRLKADQGKSYRGRFRTPTIFIRKRTERAQTLPKSLGGDQAFSHTLSVLSDTGYRLQLDAPIEFTTAYRNYLNKGIVKKLLASVPKVLHTYQRAAYFQSFTLPADYKGRVQPQTQRVPSIVKPKRVASYEPMLISIPIEVMVVLVIVGIWAWNRERYTLRSARSSRIKLN